MARAQIAILPELNTPYQEIEIVITHSVSSDDPTRKRSVLVNIRTDADSSQRITRIDDVVLEESKPNSGVFTGSIQLSPDRERIPGDLEVLPGDIVTIVYDIRQLEPTIRKEDAVVTRLFEIASFDPEFALDKDLYNMGDKVIVSMSDPGANLHPHSEDLVSFRLFSDSDPKGILLVGKESGRNTGVFKVEFKLASRTDKNSIRVGAGDTITIAYTSEFPADYRERVESNVDPRKTFFFSFDVGIPLEDEKILERLKSYFDPTIYDKITRGAYLATTNKTITIVFWDIRGFSKMSDSLRTNPKLTVDFLEEYSELATNVVALNGGVLDKFIGDGVMALFGVFGPQDEEQAAVSAVNAALDFREGFLLLIEKWKPIWSAVEEQEIKLALGCAINTGEVLVGGMGGERKHFTAVGRAVNIASRLQGESENKILITSTAKDRLKNRFDIVYGGTAKLKNIPGDFPYFEVVGRHGPKASL